MPDTYISLPDGRYVRIPPDATPTQLAALRTRLGGASPTFGADALSKAESIGPQPSRGPIADRLESLRQRLQQKVTTGSQSGAGEFMASAPLGALRVAEGAAEGGPATGRGIKDIAGGLAQAATMPSLVMGPEAAGVAAGAVPTTAKAGAKFEDVMNVAKNTRVAKLEPFKAAERASEIGSRGGTTPKVIGDFLKRTENIGTKPLTYAEARDFYQNARMSLDEHLANIKNPAMRRQVVIFKQALGEAVQDALRPTGKLPVYQSAMTEYRRAKTLQKLIIAAAGAGIKGVGLSKLYGLVSKIGQ